MLRTFKAVFWGFFGVRKGRDHDLDALNLKIGHVIAAGVVSALLFVLVLLAIVKWIVP